MLYKYMKSYPRPNPSIKRDAALTRTAPYVKRYA